MLYRLSYAPHLGHYHVLDVCYIACQSESDGLICDGERYAGGLTRSIREMTIYGEISWQDHPIQNGTAIKFIFTPQNLIPLPRSSQILLTSARGRGNLQNG